MKMFRVVPRAAQPDTVLEYGLAADETGDWKVAGTRRLESLRYVAPTFLSAGSGDFPVPSSEPGQDCPAESKLTSCQQNI